MTRSALRALLLTLAAWLCATAAAAQDPLTRARAEYAGLTGDWAEAGRGCADPSGTWSFGMDTIRAGDALFDLRGIGAGPGTIRLDMVDRRTGRRLPLALSASGGRLGVRGRGVALTLLPCDRGTLEPVRPPGTITARPLDGLPSEDDLRARLGTPTVPDDPLPQDGTAATETGLSPEDAYDTRMLGAWRGPDGSCGWRLERDRIFAEGAAYDVVNISGTAGRIGIQTLRDDGTPTTFTLTPGTGGTTGVSGSVAGEGGFDATLTRC